MAFQEELCDAACLFVWGVLSASFLASDGTGRNAAVLARDGAACAEEAAAPGHCEDALCLAGVGGGGAGGGARL